MNSNEEIENYCNEVAGNFANLKALSSVILEATDVIVSCLEGGHKVLFCGNGGSASDAQHLSAEFMGRFLVDRAPLAALALTVDTSALTAIANDYSFDEIFSRQLRGVGVKGDVLVGLTTSGNSANVINAVKVASEMGIKTIGFTGQEGGELVSYTEIAIRVPSHKTNHIQEMHIAVGHMICGLVEAKFS